MGIPAKSRRAYRNSMAAVALALGAVGAAAALFTTDSVQLAFLVFLGLAIVGAMGTSLTFTCPRCWKSASILSIRPGSYCRACGTPEDVKGLKKICSRCKTSRRFRADTYCVHCGGKIFGEA